VTLDLTTALERHLQIPAAPATDGFQYKSSLAALLVDVRGAAQRDLATGRPLQGGQHHSWLAATGYLILVDQIGTCFDVVGRSSSGEKAFIRALDAFSPERDMQIWYALYALRCALAHDYSLFNQSNDAKKRHAFNLTADPALPLVCLPARTWSGTYDVDNLPPEEEITVVNLHKVADLVEDMVAKLQRLHAERKLAIRASLSIDEFHLRYGLQYRVS
jgi:hypothetical protein